MRKMKNILIFVVCLSIFLSSCDFFDDKFFNKNSHVRDEDYEQIADKVTARVALKMKKEKGLQCIGTGGGMMTDIQRMAMSFQFFHEVDLDEARDLLVYTVTEYLNAINSSKEVRPYLHDYPFKAENLQIFIWIKKPNGEDVSFNQIDFLSSVRAVLKYKLPDEPKTHADRELHRETYEEALKIVNDQAKAS